MKRVILLFITVVVIIVVSFIYAGQIDSVMSGLVSLWHLNEGTGDVARDEIVANNNAGSLSAPAWVTGIYGTALDFDGNDDAVNCGNSATLNPAAMSIVAWIYLHSYNAVAGGSAILGRDVVSFRAYVFMVNAADKAIQCQIGGTGAGGSSSNSILLNRWYHVATTGSSTTGWRYYVNGVLDGTANWAAIPVKVDYTYIGRRGYTDGNEMFFDGVIDEVAIFNTALTPGQILNMHRKGSVRHYR